MSKRSIETCREYVPCVQSMCQGNIDGFFRKDGKNQGHVQNLFAFACVTSEPC